MILSSQTDLREVATEASSSRALCLCGRQGHRTRAQAAGGVGGGGGGGGDQVSTGRDLVSRPLSCGR